MPPGGRAGTLRVLAIVGAAVAPACALWPGIATPRSTAALLLAWLLATVGAIAWRLASALARDAAPSVFLLASALTGLSLAAGVVTWTGAVGAFGPPVVVGVVAAAAWFVHALTAPGRRVQELWRAARAGRRFDVVAAGCAVLLAGAFAVVVKNQLAFTTQDADSMWYHLVMPAEWVRTGSTWPGEVVPLMARGYPGFRQAVVALLSLPMRSEHLALLGVLEFPLLALAVYALGRSFGGARPHACGGAVAAAMTPVALGALGTQGNDLMLAILVTASVVFLQRFFAAGARGDGVLAGLALGALAATKFSGPGYAVAIVAVIAIQHGVRAWWSWRNLLALAAGPLVLAVPWYGRNLLAFGNPLWPAEVGVAGRVLFAGPLPKAFFAERTLGWQLGPLWRDLHQFVEAHGWLAPLAGASFLLLAVGACVARRPLRPVVAGMALPPLLFVAFLHHPFNVPWFDASYSHRYLIAWASTGFAAAAAAATMLLPVRVPVGLLFAGAAVLGLATVTRLAWPLAALAAVGAALLLPGRGRAVATALVDRVSGFAVPIGLVLFGIAAGAGVAESVRARWQYDPALGYRDGDSERGWAGCVSFVHREIAGKRVGLHGSHFLFPLLGEPWSNEVHLADQPLVPGTPKSLADVVAWVDERRIDVLVCCLERTARTGRRTWEHAPSIGPALVAAHPQRFTVVYEDRGAQVLAVRH